MESGNIPPAPADPAAAAEKKFKIAAGVAVVLGIAAIGFAVWAISLNSDVKSDNSNVANDNALQTVNAKRIADAKANFESIRNQLSSRDQEDSELQNSISQLKKDVSTAKAQEDEAVGADDKEAATAKSFKLQLALAQACAQAAVRSASTLTDESNGDAGLSAIEGTIAKLTTVTNDCKAVLN